jgi:centromeric protein E
MKKQGTASSVTVAVRVRPLSEREAQMPDQTFALDLSDKHVSLPNDSTYVFDAVFGPEQTTLDVYDAIAEPIVSSSLAGINGTIFAYGQTASGKTFSMQGSEEHPGILRLAARQLFEFAKDAEWSYGFVVSYVEIYNERVKDLFNNATSKSAQDAASDLKIREDRVTGFYVDGVVERAVTSYEQLMELFEEGEKRRHVAGTDMNLKSSRSHTVFTINVTAKQKPNEAGDFAFGTLKSRLSLVDLAGSESARLTNAEGERLKEGAQINKSLLALSMVINSLAKAGGKDAHVKFRDSKLTQLLQPSLAGNCRTSVLCCVTPAVTFLSETSSTLKFASSAKHIQTQYVVNQIADATRSMKSYQEQVEALTRALHDERQVRALAESAVSAQGAERVLELKAEVTRLQQAMARTSQGKEEALAQLELLQLQVERLQEMLNRAEEAKAISGLAQSEKIAALEAMIVSLEAREGETHSAMRAQVDREREQWRKALEQAEAEKQQAIEAAGSGFAQQMMQMREDMVAFEQRAAADTAKLLAEFDLEKAKIHQAAVLARMAVEERLSSTRQTLTKSEEARQTTEAQAEDLQRKLALLEREFKTSEQRHIQLQEQLGKDTAMTLEDRDKAHEKAVMELKDQHAKEIASLAEANNEQERGLNTERERLSKKLKEVGLELEQEKSQRHRVEKQLSEALALKRQLQDEMAAERRRAVECESQLQEQLRAEQRVKSALERELEAERISLNII